MDERAPAECTAQLVALPANLPPHGTETTCPTCWRTFHAFNHNVRGRCRETCTHRWASGYIIQRDGRRQNRRICVIRSHAEGWRKTDPVVDVPLRDCQTADPPIVYTPCARCGSTDRTEYHHRAPQAIFADAWEWPCDHLCRSCRTTWHNAMRTARGISLPEPERVTAPSAQRRTA